VTRVLEPRTVGERWRLRRDLAVCLAHRGGLSQRAIADVFDVAQSTVHQILRETSAHADALLAAAEGARRNRPAGIYARVGPARERARRRAARSDRARPPGSGGVRP
jgi:transposase